MIFTFLFHMQMKTELPWISPCPGLKCSGSLPTFKAPVPKLICSIGDEFNQSLTTLIVWFFFIQAKLRYDPIELDPEEMCRMASEQPQVSNGLLLDVSSFIQSHSFFKHCSNTSKRLLINEVRNTVKCIILL